MKSVIASQMWRLFGLSLSVMVAVDSGKAVPAICNSAKAGAKCNKKLHKVELPSASFLSRRSDSLCWDDAVLGKTEWRLTYDMCRRSRTNVGDNSRLRTFLLKMARGQCAEISVLGGSSTLGFHPFAHTGGGWPSYLEALLNAHFPCVAKDASLSSNGNKSEGASGHVIHNLAQSMSGTDTFVELVARWRLDNEHPIWRSDLIIGDFSNNDASETLKALLK